MQLCAGRKCTSMKRIPLLAIVVLIGLQSCSVPGKIVRGTYHTVKNVRTHAKLAKANARADRAEARAERAEKANAAVDAEPR